MFITILDRKKKTEKYKISLEKEILNVLKQENRVLTVTCLEKEKESGFYI